MVTRVKNTELIEHPNTLPDRLRQQARNLGRYISYFRKVAKNPALMLEDTFDNHKYLELLPLVIDRYGKFYNHPEAVRKLKLLLGEHCKYRIK